MRESEQSKVIALMLHYCAVHTRRFTKSTASAIIAVAALFAVSFDSKAVHADDSARPLSSIVQLTPGATCLRHDQLMSQVISWLGRDELDDQILKVEVVGDSQNARAVTIRLVLRDAERVRRFALLPAACGDALAVVGLAIALAIDARVLGDVTESAPVGIARTLLGLQVAASYAALPGLSAGAALGVDHALNAWLRARLDLVVQGAPGHALEGTRGVVDSLGWAVAPQLCAGGSLGPHGRLALCSGALFGMVHVRGRGFERSADDRAPWLLASTGLRAEWTLGIPWLLDVQALLPIRSPALVGRSASGQERRERPGTLGVLVALGPAWLF